MLRFVSVSAAERIHGSRPTSRGRPPAAFLGTGRWGKRRLFPKKGFSRVWNLERVRAGSAGDQCLRRVGHARPPHEQGAVLLRFVSVRVAERIHGSRPTSRGLPPAAFLGTGRWGKRRRFQKRGFPRVWTLERVQAGSAGGQRRWLRIHAPKPHEQGAGVLRFGSDEATVRADGGRGEVKGGWGRRRAPDVRPYVLVLGICEGMEGRRAKGKGTGLWTLGAAQRPVRMPPTAKARPSVDLKT